MMLNGKSLRENQSEFAQAVGCLLMKAYYLGYEVTFGDTYPGKFPHRENSFHNLGLAIDINLFKYGKYLTKTSDHLPLGEYWESLGGTWGGRWEDGNHYSWVEGK